MSPFTHHVIEVFHNDVQDFFWVEKEEKGILHAIDMLERSHRINPSRVVFTHAPTSADNTSDVPALLNAIKIRILTEQEQIDLRLLWECVGEVSYPISLQQMAAEYFCDHSSLCLSALYRQLREDRLFFKRKGDDYIPRTQAQIDELLLQQQREQDKKEKQAQLLSLLQRLYQAPVEALTPGEWKQILPLQTALYEHELERFESILQGLDTGKRTAEIICRILLHAGLAHETDNRMLLEGGIREHFAPEITTEAEQLTHPETCPQLRDLTHLACFSIDDADTREVDDALSVENVNDGYCLGIHIADASGWIAKDTPLDRCARQRITSLYLETGTIPMLPPILAYERISLQANTTRFAVSLLITVTPEGHITHWEFCHSIIRLHENLSYDNADDYLEGKDHPLRKALEILRVCSSHWNALRLEKGAVEIQKPEFSLKVKDDTIRLQFYDRNSPSRKLVSECMILYNMLLAEYTSQHDIPVIYRSQEMNGTPIPMPANTPYDPVHADQIMRQMRPGRMTTIPMPHAGLGVDQYLQVTSPIRRYADLVLQRQILADLEQLPLPYDTEELFELLAAIEENEKYMRDIYQRSRWYWLIRYLELNCQEGEFKAMVINPGQSQCTVELLEWGFRTVVAGNQRMLGETVNLKLKKTDAELGVLVFQII